MAEAWQCADLRPQFGDSRGVCGVVRMGVGIFCLPLCFNLSHKSYTLEITFSFS